jgi:hypothetical protein
VLCACVCVVWYYNLVQYNYNNAYAREVCTCSSGEVLSNTYWHPLNMYRAADNSLARPTSRFILFDGRDISFDTSLVIYINSTIIPPIMIINRIYETQNLSSL